MPAGHRAPSPRTTQRALPRVAAVGGTLLFLVTSAAWQEKRLMSARRNFALQSLISDSCHKPTQTITLCAAPRLGRTAAHTRRRQALLSVLLAVRAVRHSAAAGAAAAAAAAAQSSAENVLGCGARMLLSSAPSFSKPPPDPSPTPAAAGLGALTDPSASGRVRPTLRSVPKRRKSAAARRALRPPRPAARRRQRRRRGAHRCSALRLLLF